MIYANMLREVTHILNIILLLTCGSLYASRLAK